MLAMDTEGYLANLHESQTVPHGLVDVYGEFNGELAAKFAREAYLKKFDPIGYGTILTISFKHGKYVVAGCRADSCE